MHHCSLLNVVLLSLNAPLLSFECNTTLFECSANGCRVMRNKALNATLEQRSTPLINGTEITLGAVFVALWKRMEGWGGGRSILFVFTLHRIALLKH